MFTIEEIAEIIKKADADRPRMQEIKRKQLEYFQRLCPNRCGNINLERIEVEYNDEKYTVEYGNYRIVEIEDRIRCWDLVGLDYELRVAKLHDPSDVFTIKFPSTEEESKKYWLAHKLYFLYINYYRELLIQNGMDIQRMKASGYLAPWTGCERELMPEKYAESVLLTEKEIMDVLEKLYLEVLHKKEMELYSNGMKFEGDYSMEKYRKAYEKYRNQEIPQTIIDAEKTLQNIYISATIYEGGKKIGVIAENIATKEVFLVEQKELNEKIKGDGYIAEPYLGNNIRLVREAMRYGEDIGFPYTTMVIDVDQF